MTPLTHIKHFLVTIAVAVLVACGSNDPSSMVKQIDELQAKNLPMTAEQKAQFAQADQKGRALLKAGKSSEAAEQLQKALAVLQQAEDTAMFNKSE